MNEEDRISTGVAQGILVVLLVAAFSLLTVLGPFVIGLTEWLGLLPLILYQRHEGRGQVARGVVMVGAVVFLLQAACYGLVFMGTLGTGLRH